MEKMTNEDIIKNLRHCAASEGCGKDCQLYKEYGCYFKLMYAAADALERLVAEIDRKDKAIQGLLNVVDKKNVKIDQWKRAWKTAYKLYESVKESKGEQDGERAEQYPEQDAE